MTNTNLLIQSALEEYEKLAKDYANASYLVSEENHPEKEEIEALNKLKAFLTSKLTEAYNEGYEAGKRDKNV